MTTLKLSSLAQAVAICVGATLFCGNALAATKGDKVTYDQAKSSAKATYDTDKKACDAMSGNAKDICVAEAKAKRVKTQETAEADYKNTPKARERAIHEGAEADYKVAKERCDDKAGNAKDVCIKEAKAALTKTEANAEASYKNTPKAREHAIHEIAEVDYKVAKERCDDKAGNDKDVCIKEAKAVLTRTEADAKATKKGTEARIDASKDKRDADYKVAAEKCDALAGDPKAACIADAKARFGK